MPDPITLGLLGASLLGGLFGGKKQKTQQQQQTVSKPSFDPAFGPLRDALLARTMRSISMRSPLPAGFVNQRLQNVNQTFGGVNQALRNRLNTSGFGPASGAAAAGFGALEGARGSALSQSLNEVPMIENQLRNEGLDRALATLGLGRGQETTTTGTTTDSGGGGFGGGVSDLASMLGFLFAQGKIGGPKKPGMTGPGFLAGGNPFAALFHPRP